MILTQYQRACLICAPELLYSYSLRLHISVLKLKRSMEKTKYKYNAIVNYTITDNLCTICANNPSNIDNNPYLLGGRNKCQKSNETVCECIEFKNYNDLIKK